MTMSEIEVKQVIFNAAYNGLRSQNFRRSVGPVVGTRKGSAPPLCVYRAEGGLKCAIGHVIADEHYSTDLELQCASAKPVRQAVAKSLGVPTALVLPDFCVRLQSIHDNSESSTPMETRLKTFANSYGLTIPAE